MPQIEIAFMLPYFLLLENGQYPTGAGKKDPPLFLRDVDIPGNHAFPKRTQVSLHFEGSVVSDDDIQRLKSSQIEKLLQRTNHLLRWYRACTARGAITEITRAQASPFVFRSGDQDIPSLWLEEVSFESNPLPLNDGQTIRRITKAVKSGLASKNDPEVSRLFLLDAEQALRDGRFRETVLFCWSAIDSTFSQKYKSLVQGAVDVANEREALTNFRNASMRYRMSAGLYFCTGKSLYEQPDGLWTNLLESYSKRNSIIHDGASAQETDAELALSVARQVVKVMASLKPKKLAKKK